MSELPNCCCGMTDEPNVIQRCLPRGMDMGGHCSYPESWCNRCPLDQATGGRTTAPDDLCSRIQPTVTFGNEETDHA